MSTSSDVGRRANLGLSVDVGAQLVPQLDSWLMDIYSPMVRLGFDPSPDKINVI